MKRILLSIALSSVLLTLNSTAAAAGISTVPGAPKPAAGVIVDGPDAGIIVDRPDVRVIIE